MKNIFEFKFGFFLAVPIVALALLIGGLSGPFAEPLVYAWSAKDLNLRARLVANSLSDGTIEELPQEESSKVKRQFENLVKDERLYAIGFCRTDGKLTNASKEFSSDFKCSPDSLGQSEDGERFSLPSGKNLFVNRIPVLSEELGRNLGSLVIIHDLAYVELRASETRHFLQTATFIVMCILTLLFCLIAITRRLWIQRLQIIADRKQDLRLKRNLNLEPLACATVVIPTLNESKRIAEVVAYALTDPATAEVIVVDDSSTDDTVSLAQQAGARVITSSMLGKGASMSDGIAAAKSDLLVYLDGDLTGLRSGIITDLCLPLLREEADFVKARFGRGGGRVTELTAKPMLKIFFPELAHFSQPLGGIISARKSLLQALTFEDGYGVDIALLIDAHLAGAKLAEVNIGSLEHDSQPLHDLALMVNEVSQVIFSRAKTVGRLHVEQVAAMYEVQRQAEAEFEYIVTRSKGRQRLLLLDMDGTITPSRFVVELARVTGHEASLEQLLDGHDDDAATRTDNIAKLFQYTHRQKFEQVARAIEIRSDVIEFVNQMKRRGFMVGVISDSYFVAADIIRRRIFADFAIAHVIQFDSDVCTGQIRINPAFISEPADTSAPICKSNVLRRFLTDKALPSINLSWVVGDNVNDLALMRLADRAFVIDPKSPAFQNEPDIVPITSFANLLTMLDDVDFEQDNQNKNRQSVTKRL